MAFCNTVVASGARVASGRTCGRSGGVRAGVCRRVFVQLLTGAVTVIPKDWVLADVLGEREENEVGGFSFRVPLTGWTRSTASLSSFRPVVVFVNDEDGDSNINVVSTPVAGDFRKLTSFGTMDNVLNTLVPSGKKDIEGKVISSRMDVGKNAYVVEYTITSAGVTRHLLTVFSLQPGRYLNTLTAQAREENWQAREDVMRAVADSYTLNILD